MSGGSNYVNNNSSSGESGANKDNSKSEGNNNNNNNSSGCAISSCSAREGRDQLVGLEAGRLEVLHMTRGTVPKLLLTVLVSNLCFSLTLQRAISISTEIKHYVQRLWLQIEVVMSVQ